MTDLRMFDQSKVRGIIEDKDTQIATLTERLAAAEREERCLAAESSLSTTRAALEAAREIIRDWTLAPWTSPTGRKPNEPPCLSGDFWHYMMKRCHDFISTRTPPSPEPEAGAKPSGYCACGHASADHFFDAPHACNFGHPCRCAGFNQDEKI